MRSPFISKLYAGEFLPCNKVHKISMKQEKGAGQWDNDTAFISLVPSSWQWIFDICIVNVVSPLCLQFHSSCSFSASWLKFKKMAHFHSVGPKIFLVGPALCRWRYLWLPKVGSRSRLAWPIMLYYRHPLPLCFLGCAVQSFGVTFAVKIFPYIARSIDAMLQLSGMCILLD